MQEALARAWRRWEQVGCYQDPSLDPSRLPSDHPSGGPDPSSQPRGLTLTNTITTWNGTHFEPRFGAFHW